MSSAEPSVREDKGEVKRTRVAEDDKKKKQVDPPAFSEAAGSATTSSVPAGLSAPKSTDSVPSWSSKAEPSSAPFASTSSSSSSSHSSSVPAWLKEGSSSPFAPLPGAVVPSWLTAGAAKEVPSWLTQDKATSSSFSVSSTSATFGALSTASSVFGAKEDKEDEDNDEEEEENGEDQADAAFGAPAAEGEEEALWPPVSSTESGEEHETVVLQLRAKLFVLVKGEGGPTWSEMGFGPLRVNVPTKDTDAGEGTPRVIMRRHGVWTLLLNAPIVAGMSVSPVGDKMVRLSCESFSGEETRTLATFLVKCSREDDRNELLKKIVSLIPEEVAAEEKPAVTVSEKADDKE